MNALLFRDIVAAAEFRGIKFDATNVTGDTVEFFLDSKRVHVHRVVDEGSYKETTMAQPHDFRAMSDAEIALINEGQELAKQVGTYVDKLKASETACDMRWVATGATDLQKGFMALARSIAQPKTF